MLVLREKTHQVCTIDSWNVHILSSFIILCLNCWFCVPCFALATQITLTFLWAILARRLLMLLYSHASLYILPARKSDSNAFLVSFSIPLAFGLLISRQNVISSNFCIDAETRGSCGTRRLGARGVLVLFLFATSRSAIFLFTFPFFLRLTQGYVSWPCTFCDFQEAQTAINDLNGENFVLVSVYCYVLFTLHASRL